MEYKDYDVIIKEEKVEKSPELKNKYEEVYNDAVIIRKESSEVDEKKPLI